MDYPTISETRIADALVSLTTRASALRTELTDVERRLLEIRTAEELCPDCAGTGLIYIRGGLYGERQPARCQCSQ